MPSRPRQGVLITLEGGEGSGKSSQAEALAARLRDGGHSVTVTREPAGTALGELVKSVFQEGTPVSPETELFLFAAARADHVRNVIRPALDRGDIVLCDRYTDSTVAYQGYGRGLGADRVRAVNQIATGGLEPHFTLLLDVPPQVGLRRKDHERVGDSIGRESVEFHRQVRDGFLDLSRREPKRIAVVDASAPADVVSDDAWKRLTGFLARLQ